MEHNEDSTHTDTRACSDLCEVRKIRNFLLKCKCSKELLPIFSLSKHWLLLHSLTLYSESYWKETFIKTWYISNTKATCFWLPHLLYFISCSENYKDITFCNSVMRPCYCTVLFIFFKWFWVNLNLDRRVRWYRSTTDDQQRCPQAAFPRIITPVTLMINLLLLTRVLVISNVWRKKPWDTFKKCKFITHLWCSCQSVCTRRH